MPAAFGGGSGRGKRGSGTGQSSLGITKRQRHNPCTADRRLLEVPIPDSPEVYPLKATKWSGRTILMLSTLCPALHAAEPADSYAEKLKGRTIALDAGHEQSYASPHCSRCPWLASGRSSFFYDIRLPYPENPLAIADGPYQGAIPEYRLNQNLVLKLAAVLEKAGAKVVLTRINRYYREDRQISYRESYHQGKTTKIFLEPPEMTRLVERAKQRNPYNKIPIDLIYTAAEDSSAAVDKIAALENILGRAELANQAGADIALIIHADAINHADKRGRLMFVYHPGQSEVHDRQYRSPPSGNSLLLAQAINKVLETLEDRIPLEGIYGRDLWYLGIAQMPAVLIELGRMTSKEDMDILAAEKNRRDMAAAIARGISRYLEK